MDERRGIIVPASLQWILPPWPWLHYQDLDNRMFHRVGGDGRGGASNSPVTGNLAAPNRINSNPTTIRWILTESLISRFNGTSAKPSSFHPEETNLVVILPRDIIGRADVNIFWFQGNPELGLNRLGFGDSLFFKRLRLSIWGNRYFRLC